MDAPEVNAPDPFDPPVATESAPVEAPEPAEPVHLPPKEAPKVEWSYVHFVSGKPPRRFMGLSTVSAVARSSGGVVYVFASTEPYAVEEFQYVLTSGSVRRVLYNPRTGAVVQVFNPTEHLTPGQMMYSRGALFTDEATPAESSLVKQLTGGDEIYVRDLYGEGRVMTGDERLIRLDALAPHAPATAPEQPAREAQPRQPAKTETKLFPKFIRDCLDVRDKLSAAQSSSLKDMHRAYVRWRRERPEEGEPLTSGEFRTQMIGMWGDPVTVAHTERWTGRVLKSAAPESPDDDDATSDSDSDDAELDESESVGAEDSPPDPAPVPNSKSIGRGDNSAHRGGHRGGRTDGSRFPVASGRGRGRHPGK